MIDIKNYWVQKVTDYDNAIIALDNNDRVMHDFYVFNNIILGLTGGEVDFRNFNPATPEQMWAGIHIINKRFPDIISGGDEEPYYTNY